MNRTETERRLAMIPTRFMVPSGRNPRMGFDPESARELEESIGKHGVLQNLVLMPIPEGKGEEFLSRAKKSLPQEISNRLSTSSIPQFVIVAGECRWRAAVLGGIAQLPARIEPFYNEDRLEEIMIEENIKRQPLSHWELAHFISEAFKRMRERDIHTTQGDVATRFRISQSQVSNLMKLFELPHDIQALVRDRKVNIGVATQLGKITNKSMRDHFLKLFLQGKMTQDEWFDLVKKYIQEHQSLAVGKKDKGARETRDKYRHHRSGSLTRRGNGGSSRHDVVPEVSERKMQCICHLCPVHGGKKIT